MSTKYSVLIFLLKKKGTHLARLAIVRSNQAHIYKPVYTQECRMLYVVRASVRSYPCPNYRY